MGQKQFDENRLKDIAEKQGYGYKYANLFELQALCQSFNDPKKAPLQVAVPAFFGIKSNTIIATLKRKNFDIAEEWAKVLATVNANEKKEALKTKQIKNDFWEK